MTRRKTAEQEVIEAQKIVINLLENKVSVQETLAAIKERKTVLALIQFLLDSGFITSDIAHTAIDIMFGMDETKYDNVPVTPPGINLEKLTHKIKMIFRDNTPMKYMSSNQKDLFNMNKLFLQNGTVTEEVFWKDIATLFGFSEGIINLLKRQTVTGQPKA